jgi:hypothetical protein
LRAVCVRVRAESSFYHITQYLTIAKYMSTGIFAILRCAQDCALRGCG